MDEDVHEQVEADLDEGDGEYYGELYGADARFEWFWWAVTWLTIPLFIAYFIYRFLT